MHATVFTKYDEFGIKVRDKYMSISECNNIAKQYGIASFGIRNIQKDGSKKDNKL